MPCGPRFLAVQVVFWRLIFRFCCFEVSLFDSLILVTLEVLDLSQHLVENLIAPFWRISGLVNGLQQIAVQLALQIVVIEPVCINGGIRNQLVNFAGKVNATGIFVLESVLISESYENIIEGFFFERDTQYNGAGI